MKLIDDIFNHKPSQWGLRGDPYMWQELKRSLSGLENNLNQSKFEEELENRFHELIKQNGKQTSKDIVWFENFPQSGMSGGLISLEWWQETGLSIIKDRYKELNK